MKYQINTEDFWKSEENRKKYKALFKRYNLSKKIGSRSAEIIIEREYKNYKTKLGMV